MGRRLFLFFMALTIVVVPFLVGTEAAAAVPVYLDGKRLDEPAVLVSNRTLLPFRALLEPLGASVEWGPATRTVHATKEALSLTLTIGERVAYVNGNPVALDVPPQILHDRTMVPVRFVGETLGATAGWGALSRTVIVSTAQKQAVTVKGVTDSLALTVKQAEEVTTLRLAGLAFPQTSHPTAEEEAFRRERRAALERLVGQPVAVVWSGAPGGAQGEAHGYVFRSDGTFLNAELVSRGYAVRGAAAGDGTWDALLAHLQRHAELARRGYWGLGGGGSTLLPSGPQHGIAGGRASDAARKATLQVPGAALQLVSRSSRTHAHLTKEQAVWRVVKAGRVWGTLTVAQHAVRNRDYV